MKDFIKINNEFWDKSAERNDGGVMLVEEVENSFILHILSSCSVILNRAKGYVPLFVQKNPNYTEEFYRSYVSCAKVCKSPKLSVFENLLTDISSLGLYLQILCGKRILDIRYKNMQIGDIVYDMYLTLFSQGTIRNPNPRILKVLRKCIRQIKKTEFLMKKHNVKSGLFSHRIGLSAGITLRTLLAHGAEIYSFAGNSSATICRSTDLTKTYEYTPTREEIEKIKSLPDDKFNELYEKVYNKQMGAGVTMDSKYAFNPKDPIYTDRERFANDFGLDASKKNVFIMSHAFNDHPHTHFDGMVFNDYADWLIKTLEYAKTDNSVNWIFKRHPSDRFYPCLDIDWKKMFENCPKNVVLIDEDNKINSKSLPYVADAVVTCAGSCGFEMPAMAAIPCITAGDSAYSKFEFTSQKFTKDEYFKALSNLSTVEKLSAEAQKTAKAFYIFFYLAAKVKFDFVPELSFEEQKNPSDESSYWDKVLNAYETKKDLIREEVDKYASQIAKDDFRVLRGDVLND